MTKVMRCTAIALLVSLSLGGCVHNQYQAPLQLTAEQPLPMQYQLEAQPAKWWQQLQDPQLMTLLQQAGAQNASLLAARANIKRYAALQRDAADNNLPKPTATAEMERSQQGKDEVVSSRYQQGVSIVWQLDLSGAVALAEQAAQQDREIAVLRLQELQLAVLTQVARHYGDWLGAQLQIDVAQANLANLAKTRRIVQAQLDSGSASALELTRLQAQVYQVEAGLPALYLQQSQAQLALAALTAQPEVALTKRSLPQFSQPLALSQWQHVLAKRPDLAIAERQLAKAYTQLALEKAAWYPQLSLQGFLGFVSLGTQKTGSEQQSWSLMPSLSLPAADPMAVIDRIDASNASAEVALQQYRAQVFDVIRDLKSSLAAYNQGRRAQLVQQQQLAASGEAVRLTRLRYESGMADFLQLLDAERELLSAREQQARLHLANYQQVVDLYQQFAAGLAL